MCVCGGGGGWKLNIETCFLTEMMIITVVNVIERVRNNICKYICMAKDGSKGHNKGHSSPLNSLACIFSSIYELIVRQRLLLLHPLTSVASMANLVKKKRKKVTRRRLVTQQFNITAGLFLTWLSVWKREDENIISILLVLFFRFCLND